MICIDQRFSISHTYDTRIQEAGTGGPSKFQEHTDTTSTECKISMKPSILPNFNVTTYILWKKNWHIRGSVGVQLLPIPPFLGFLGERDKKY